MSNARNTSNATASRAAPASTGEKTPARRIDLVFPVLPPVLDGIGDHTARLAEALAAGGRRVRVLTAQREADAIPGVDVRRAFSAERRCGVRRLYDAVTSDPPAWLAVQFNQFSWGRWGLNPYLPLTLLRIKRACPGTRIAWIAHEDFVPVTSWQNAIMTLWQRAQFWALGRVADRIFFSIAPWAERYQSWFPHTPVHHLPVGSNIPRVECSRAEARRRVRIAEDTFVMGVFGSAHASRMLAHIRRAAEAVQRQQQQQRAAGGAAGDAMAVLYVGPHGDAMREALDGLPLIDAGALPARDVSVHLTAMDVHLAPFIDGVSTRRGSFMAGLQHGLPSLSTRGPLTDDLLKNADGDAFRLVPVESGPSAAFARRAVALWEAGPEQRAALGAAARDFYDRTFAWDVARRRFLDALGEAPAAPRSFSKNPLVDASTAP